jgi:hypothetical protein
VPARSLHGCLITKRGCCAIERGTCPCTFESKREQSQYRKQKPPILRWSEPRQFFALPKILQLRSR